jgi:hypothetical protein
MSVVNNVVVVISLADLPSADEWDAYERAYVNIYDTLPHFVLVFDLRGMASLPPLDFIERKRRLLLSLKPRTVCQVLGVIVLTSFEALRFMITGLVTAAGQAAPFYAFVDTRAAAEAAARMANIIQRRRFRVLATSTSAPRQQLTWAGVPYGTKVLFVMLLFIRSMHHFLKAMAAAAH